MRMRGALVVGSVLLLLGVCTPAALAQEDPDPAVPDDQAEEPAVEPDSQPAEPEAVPEAEPESEKEGFVNGLYVAVGLGSASSDSFNTSLSTDATRYTASEFEIDDQQHGIAKIGWKLKEDKGDFRLVFNGYKEQSYKFHSVGAQAGFSQATVNPDCDLEYLRDALEKGAITPEELDNSPGYVISPLGGRCLYGWWGVTIEDGKYLAERTPAEWTPVDDTNGNMGADPGEIRYLDVDRVVEAEVPDNLQNIITTWDALYGREFGGRRFSSRWWGGLRYFAYEGQMLQTAWLNADDNAEPGSYFTDQAFLPIIGLREKTTGWGPMGIWEVDFNFFNKGLVFYMKGEAAFTFNSLDVDSGVFSAIVATTSFSSLPPMRITEQRDKSSWQAGGEIGVRVRMRRGLEIELGYETKGYLDTVLVPTQVTIPKIPGQVIVNDPEATISALFSTQDLRVSGGHALVGFQF